MDVIVRDGEALDGFVFDAVDEITRHFGKHIMVEQRLDALLPVGVDVVAARHFEVREAGKPDFDDAAHNQQEFVDELVLLYDY